MITNETKLNGTVNSKPLISDFLTNGLTLITRIKKAMDKVVINNSLFSTSFKKVKN